MHSKILQDFFINAQRAEFVYKCKNTRETPMKTKAVIWFNKMCKANRLTPRYIHITENVTESWRILL